MQRAPSSLVRDVLFLLGIPIICWGAFIFSIAWSILRTKQLCYYDGAIGTVSPDGKHRAVRRNLVCEVWHQDDFEENQLVIVPAGLPATAATQVAFSSDRPFAFRWRNDRRIDVSVPVGAWLREYRYDLEGVRFYIDWVDLKKPAVSTSPVEHSKATGSN